MRTQSPEPSGLPRITYLPWQGRPCRGREALALGEEVAGVQPLRPRVALAVGGAPRLAHMRVGACRQDGGVGGSAWHSSTARRGGSMRMCCAVRRCATVGQMGDVVIAARHVGVRHVRLGHHSRRRALADRHAEGSGARGQSEARHHLPFHSMPCHAKVATTCQRPRPRFRHSAARHSAARRSAARAGVRALRSAGRCRRRGRGRARHRRAVLSGRRRRGRAAPPARGRGTAAASAPPR